MRVIDERQAHLFTKAKIPLSSNRKKWVHTTKAIWKLIQTFFLLPENLYRGLKNVDNLNHNDGSDFEQLSCDKHHTKFFPSFVIQSYYAIVGWYCFISMNLKVRAVM